MGKQYNFYIAPEEDIIFTKELIESGYSIMEYYMVEDNGGGLWKWKKVDISSFEKDIIRTTYLYREDWGELSESHRKSDVHKAPVIEQIHCKIGGKDKDTLIRGRIFLDTSYKNEIDAFDNIAKEYQKIAKEIKKKTTNKDYTFADGKTAGFPISDMAIRLIENGIRKGI